MCFLINNKQIAHSMNLIFVLFIVPELDENSRKKSKNIQEDDTIDNVFASQLDLSCVAREAGKSVRPTTIDNAFVAKLNK